MHIKDVSNRQDLLDYVQSTGYKTDNGRIPLDFYKKEINLVSFAVNALNYQVDNSKVGRFAENQRWFYLKRQGMKDPAMEDPTHAGSNILVARRQENPASPNFKYNEHYYFSQELAHAGDKKNHGSIIDLVSMHYNTDYAKSLRIIDNFLIHNQKLKENFNEVHIRPSAVNAESTAKRLSQYHNIRPFDNPKFLNDRGIDNQTINDKRFEGVINNSLSEDGKHVNTAFPIHGTQGLIGFEVRNHDFKGVIDQKQDGFWRSRLDNSLPCGKVFVSESAIDCLSHVQLNNDKSNNLYLSTAGNISSRQIELLQNLIDKGTAVKQVFTKDLDKKYFNDVVFTKDQKDHDNKVVTDEKGEPVKISYVAYNKPKELVLGFDNDQAGKMLTVKTLGKLNVSEFFGVQENGALKNSEITVYSNKTTNTGRVNWRLTEGTQNDKQEALKQIVGYFNKANEKLVGKLDEKAPFELELNKDEVNIRFKNQNKQWDEIITAVHQVKFKNSESLKIDTPITKDFNQDLKGRLGLDPVAKKKLEIFELANKIQSARENNIQNMTQAKTKEDNPMDKFTNPKVKL